MTNDNERLWLSAERSTFGSHYSLTLVTEGRSDRIGSVYPLAGGGWHWSLGLTTRDGRRVKDQGQASSAEQAREDQFNALSRIEPDRFMRLAA